MMNTPHNQGMRPLRDGEAMEVDAPRTIGFSFLGKPIEVRHWGNPTAPLRILFVCGQHGDERGIRRALKNFVQRDLAGILSRTPQLQVAIVAEANPDGAELGVRKNAQGIDLNRDHLMLEAPETRAIHRFVGAWKPQLVVDMHNFPARRKFLQDAGLQLAWDVCLDYPSNPAAGMGEGHPLMDSLLAGLELDLETSGYRFGRYCVLDPQRGVRHGTPRLVDARNVLTLRHGALTLLLEARNPSQLESRQQRRHVRHAVAHACAGILDWCQHHQHQLLALRETTYAEPRIPLRFRRQVASAGLSAPVRSISDGASSALHFPRYRPLTQGRRTVRAPYAYAVPIAAHSILRVLDRHGFQSYLAARGEHFVVAESLYGFSRKSSRQARTPLPWMSNLRYERSLEGFVIFPYQQPGGRLLALMLEPASVYSLHRGLGGIQEIQPGTLCPVRRVLAPCSPIGCDSIFEVAS